MKTKLNLVCIALVYFISQFATAQEERSWTVASESGQLLVELVTDSIGIPFGMAFLPDGKMLVSDRAAGTIHKIDTDSGDKVLIQGVPKSFCKGDGGALDILLHPDFENNHFIFYAHSAGDRTSSTLVIDRAVLQADRLVNVQRIFEAYPHYDSPSHYGTRMIFKDGYLYFTMGDRYDLASSAQSLDNHLGKVMRIREDGSIPTDNPFVDNPDARHEIWSIGHRNPQGLIVNIVTGEVWLHEHGPKGGDEINILKPGINYGWPIVSYGTDYDDSPIGEGITHMDGMEQPFYLYTPSIAPSGMEFYNGDAFPKWKNNLFIGALAKRHLNRLLIKNGQVIVEERLLTELQERIRVVKEGPEGYLYLGADSGKILRLRPN